MFWEDKAASVSLTTTDIQPMSLNRLEFCHALTYNQCHRTGLSFAITCHMSCKTVLAGHINQGNLLAHHHSSADDMSI